MPAVTYHFTGANRWEAGATVDTILQLSLANGDPPDLTIFDPVTTPGANGARMRLRKTADAATTILQINKPTVAGEEGVEIVQPPTLGQIRLIIYASTLQELSYDVDTDTALLDNRSGVYDLETGTGGAEPIVVRWIEGSWEIKPEVTRPD